MAILKIGVFFDGTGNNARNYLMKKPKHEIKKEQLEADKTAWGQDEESQMFKTEFEAEAVVPDNYKATVSTSYTTPPTNIWHLYNHYKSGKTTQGYQRGVYVSGCGTEDGEEDDLVAMATGWSLKPDGWHLWMFGGRDTGVKHKASLAIKLIEDELKKSIKDMEGYVFDSVQFELFGFSRGATTARHFANRHAAGDKALVKALKKGGLNKKLYPDIQNKPVGSINMIGLFDSVASILALSEGSVDLGDAKTGTVDITLKEGVANHVFHITAGHENRYNFALNRTLPVHTKELELPGAHSDIGGGYVDNVEERLFLSKPFYSREDKDSRNEDSKSHAAAKKQLDFLMTHPKWGPLLKLCKIEILDFCKHDTGPRKLVGSSIILKRENVRTGLELIALHAMRDYCVKSGQCVFSRFGFDQSVAPPSLPEDLVPLRDAVYEKMSMVGDKRKKHTAVDSIAPQLAAKYVHCSGYWGVVDPNVKTRVGFRSIPNPVLFNVLLTNRPTDSFERTEYTAVGEVYKR